MSKIWLFVILILLIFFLLKRNNFLLPKHEHKIVPPSPPSLPIIGHLHLLLTKNPKLHRIFQQLSSQYGSIFSLKLGVLRVVIIASPAALKECFTKYDIILANRPRVLVGKHLHYDYTTLGAASYGPLWLNLRRLTNIELFTNSRMNYFACIRVEEVRSLIKGLFIKSKDNFTKIELTSHLTNLSFNILIRMLIGKKYISDVNNNNNNENKNNHENNNNNNEAFSQKSNQKAAMLIGIMKEVFELNGKLSMVDILPFLRRFHTEKRMMAARRKMDIILDGLIEECRGNKNGHESTLIYKLLNLQELEANNYPNDIIKGIIMVRFLTQFYFS